MRNPASSPGPNPSVRAHLQILLGIPLPLEGGSISPVPNPGPFYRNESHRAILFHCSTFIVPSSLQQNKYSQVSLINGPPLS